MAPMSTKNKDMGRISVFDERKMKLKSNIVSEIRAVIEEIDTSREQLTEQSVDHIAENDLILTFNQSGTLTTFLTEAAEKHKFEVIVCESAPKFTGHQTAGELAKVGI